MIISFLNQGGGGSGVTPSEVNTLINSAITEGEYINNAEYISSAKTIVLYQDSTEVATIDATAFIKDGMVDSVTVSGSILTIVFNTDAGKEPINVDLSDVVDLSNYWTSAQTQSAINSAVSGKADTSALSAYTLQSNFVAHSGNTNIHTTLAEKEVWNGKQDALRFYTEDSDGLAQITVGTGPAIGYVEVYDNLVHFGTENTEVHIQNTGVTINNDPVVTDSQLNDYYTSAQTESAITQAVSGYQPITGMTAYTQEANFVAHSGNTNMHTTAAEKALWNSVSGKQDTLISGTNIKTINNQSLLGSGNITISGGGSGNYYEKVSGLTIEHIEGDASPQIVVEIEDGGETYNANMSSIGFDSNLQGEDATYSSNLGTGTIGNMATDHPESGVTSSRELQITTDGFTQTTENMDDNEGYSPYRSESEFNYGTGLEMHNTWTEPNQKNVGEFIESSSRVTINSQQYPYIELEDVEGNFIRIDTEGINGSPIVTEDYVNAAVSGKVDTSAITTAVTSASTDAEIPTALAVYTAIGQGGGGATYSAGTNISIDSANTINCTLNLRNGTGIRSIVIGENCTANNMNSFATGQLTKATGECSHSEGGGYTEAQGNASHSEGWMTKSVGNYSHSEGYGSTANTEGSHTEGYYVIANNTYEHSQGLYNVSNTAATASGQTLFSVGNGTSNSARHNAFEIRKNGDIYVNDGTSDVKLQDTITGTAANTTALGGLKLVSLTQSEYDQLATKDSATIYFIKNNSN